MKKLDTTQILKDYEGKEFKDKKEKPITLRTFLLNYLRNSEGLSEEEKTTAYHTGIVIGTNSQAQLEQKQYDLLKKLVDKNKAKVGEELVDIYGIEISQQIKIIIDSL